MSDLSTSARKQDASQGTAMPGGRYPINNKADLQNAIRAVGRAKGGAAGRAAVRRFIMKRAKALNASDMIPDTWAADGSLKAGSGQMTAAQDHAYDRAHGIKQGSPRDKALDAKRGVKD